MTMDARVDAISVGGTMSLAALVLTAFWLAGCELFKGGHASPAAVAGDHWQIRPASVRVYPSTRFVRYDDKIALEARVEFQDELGDPLKAVGTLRFEIFRLNRLGIAEQKSLYSWHADMLTRNANKEHYDAVTRAYLFRLGIEQLPPDLPRVLLRVMFTPPSGPRLEAEAVIATQ
jgi:hypothetical protein